MFTIDSGDSFPDLGHVDPTGNRCLSHQALFRYFIDLNSYDASNIFLKVT